ncbi:hypothetical protein [Ekhidna sp.]
MRKEGKRSRNQVIAMYLLIINTVFIIIFRIRKMMHYSMIGEEPKGFDWYMLTLCSIVIFLASYTLIGRSKIQNSSNESL